MLVQSKISSFTLCKLQSLRLSLLVGQITFAIERVPCGVHPSVSVPFSSLGNNDLSGNNNIHDEKFVFLSCFFPSLFHATAHR